MAESDSEANLLLQEQINQLKSQIHKQAETARETQIQQMQRHLLYKSELKILQTKNQMLQKHLIERAVKNQRPGVETISTISEGVEVI